MTLSDLEVVVRALLAGHADVQVREVRLAGVDRLVVKYEPPSGLRRSIRVTPVGDRGDWEFELLWSAYGSQNALENQDGRCGGDGELVIGAIRHFILDRMSWQDVLEFKP